MEQYVTQLLADIAFATENVSWPFIRKAGYDILEIPIFDEEKYAPFRELEEWTGLRKEQFPPVEMLSDDQVSRLLAALATMLAAYNWSFILQTKVPERIQYATIREMFNQQAQVFQWQDGFFEFCRPATEHHKCTLGEYCQCAFYAELFSGFVDEGLTPEEERIRKLDIEVQHLKRKHGTDWMKYYPYHLDPEYDDEDGNPFDYGWGQENDWEDE